MMGTRHLVAVQSNNGYKIAQYGQWDGYPSGQGVEVLSFLKNADLTKFKIILDFVNFYTQEDLELIYEEHTDDGMIACGGKHEQYWNKHLQHISRNAGSRILPMVYQGGVRKLKNSISFAGSSLWCEYAYVIDLDKGVFEVYKGFNKEVITDGRFVSGDPELDSTDGYEPVKLVRTYKLNNLPTEEEFLNDLELEED